MKNIVSFASFSIVFAPILSPYLLPGTSITLDVAFLLFSTCVCYAYGKKAKRKINLHRYNRFLIYAAIIPVLGILLYGNVLGFKSSYTVLLLYTCCLYFILPLIEYDKLLKYYKWLCLISGGILLLQEFMFATLGFRFSGLCPFLPVIYENQGITTMSAFIEKQMYAPRGSSFFLEPAHLAQYLLGYFCLLLGSLLNKKQLLSKELLFVALYLLLTWSGNAVVGLASIFLYYVFKAEISPSKKILFITGVIISIIYIIGTEQGEMLLERQNQVVYNSDDRISSGTIRIYRGYFVYSDLPFIQQILGAGTGYCSYSIENSSFFWMFYDFERYLNNIQTLLVAYGLVGTTIFLSHLKSVYSACDNRGRLLIITLFSLCCLESFWLEPKMILFSGIAIVLANERDKNTIQK